jgi:LPXTG-site transpeptidase (sortase) family protein
MSAPRHARRRRLPPAAGLAALAGVACLLSAAAIVWSIHAYRAHAAAAARHLLSVEAGAAAAAQRPGRTGPSEQADCVAPKVSSASAGVVRMVLDAPAIGLVAPVLASDTETALSEGVGHLPTSAWPDQAGTVVLEAHDVTFFARIDQLHPKATIELESPCRRWTYRVVGGQVVKAGTPVPNRDNTLVLVTCWPTNALYFTTTRYVLTATKTAVGHTGRRHLPKAPTFRLPDAHLPAGLSPAEVSVDTLGTPEGTLTASSDLSETLRSSAATLNTAAAAVETFDAGLLAAEQANRPWWAYLAPGPDAPAEPETLRGGVRWDSSVDVNLTGAGNQVTAATLTATLTADGATSALTVRLDALDGHWAITTWQLSPVG